MRYISDLEKYNRVRELADGGDESAKDFLMGFMEMDDEKANEYLAGIAVGNGDGQPKEDWKSVVDFLIKDENEAIDGYDKAIKFIADSDLPELTKTAYTERLNHIKAEEIEHIGELKEIL